MKLYLLAALFLPLPLCAQQVKFKALQADINLAGIGLKTTFLPGAKTELDAGLGFGLSTVLSQYRPQYVRPANSLWATDIWAPDLNYSPYVKLGFLYKFTEKPSNFYAKSQYTGWLPANHLTQKGGTKLSYQHRLALKVGYRKVLNAKQTHSLNFEAGAAVWVNYNLSFFSGGPQLNINFISDLFTRR